MIDYFISRPITVVTLNWHSCICTAMIILVIMIILILLIITTTNEKICQVIDVAIPEETGFRKRKMNTEKCQDLAGDLRKMWNIEAKVMGALGTVSK